MKQEVKCSAKVTNKCLGTEFLKHLSSIANLGLLIFYNPFFNIYVMCHCI